MEMVDLFKTLGDENRIRILNLLLQEPLCVCEIEILLGITQSNASRHLNKLKSAGFITASKDAQWVYYRMNPDLVDNCRGLIQFIQDNIHKESYTKDLDRFEQYKKIPGGCTLIKEDQGQIKQLMKNF